MRVLQFGRGPLGNHIEGKYHWEQNWDTYTLGSACIHYCIRSLTGQALFLDLLWKDNTLWSLPKLIPWLRKDAEKTSNLKSSNSFVGRSRDQESLIHAQVFQLSQKRHLPPITGERSGGGEHHAAKELQDCTKIFLVNQ